MRLEGERLTPGPVPVPDRTTDCGLPAALSVMLTCADSEPTTDGVKVTLKVQVPPAARELVHVLLARVKSALLVPATTRLEILRVALPLFVRVTDCAAVEAPSDSVPKVRVVGERPTAGAVPVPVRVTCWGLVEALSLKVMLAVRMPAALGVNVTLTVQLPPAASELPQVLV